MFQLEKKGKYSNYNNWKIQIQCAILIVKWGMAKELEQDINKLVRPQKQAHSQIKE